jgi:hypothetical protein
MPSRLPGSIWDRPAESEVIGGVAVIGRPSGGAADPACHDSNP